MRLNGRVAIVTGASKGLGAALVRAYAHEGMKIIAAARNGDALTELAGEFPGAIEPFVCDVADAAQVAGLVELAVSSFGGLDVIVSNAGIAPAGSFIDM